MSSKFYFTLLVLNLVACGDDACPAGEVRIGAACVGAPDAGETDANMQSDGSARLDCTGMVEGAVCGEALLCIGEACLDTRCGDGYVDELAGELCDDGNEVSGDGCEPAVCTFSCTPETEESCNDGDPCNGEEVCGIESHRCEVGEPVEETACELEDATIGICSAGLCAPLGCGNGVREGDEECDDSNDDQGDGCRSDCTFTCIEDTDCSDADACTVETCDVGTHTCVMAPDLECNDEDPCTVDSCDPVAGCAFTLIDADEDGYAESDVCATEGLNGGDCNDTNDGVYPGAPELCDGLNNDCDENTDEDIAQIDCRADDDMDGYGDSTDVIRACVCPIGTLSPRMDDYVDCNDSNSSVHEDQTSYFDSPHCSDDACGDVLPYDYDCDGVEEERYANVRSGDCVIFSGDLCSGSGWVGSIPPCGVMGTFQTCISSGGGVCGVRIATRIQTCR